MAGILTPVPHPLFAKNSEKQLKLKQFLIHIAQMAVSVWLTLNMSNVCTYLNSTEFKSFRIEFNLSRCRLKSDGAFSHIFIKLSMDRNRISLEICGATLMFMSITNENTPKTDSMVLFDRLEHTHTMLVKHLTVRHDVTRIGWERKIRCNIKKKIFA